MYICAKKNSSCLVKSKKSRQKEKLFTKFKREKGKICARNQRHARGM